MSKTVKAVIVVIALALAVIGTNYGLYKQTIYLWVRDKVTGIVTDADSVYYTKWGLYPDDYE